MNKLLQKITPEWALRAGLGIMYVYSGIDILRHPTAWHWAIRPLLKWFPTAMQTNLGRPEVMNQYLIFQGIGELILAFLLLAWFLPKYLARWAALITTLEFAAILLLVPIDAITFRDIGLLGAALTLYLILLRGKVEVLDEKHESDGEKQAGQPLVETFDEYMSHHDNK